ncbi:MAG: DUF502 domain-containing protein [Puniceicoccales bacterium]|jgi:uncharacterized membrane protein|nr:DUF502 domain-containing protein [Puniceicoccales bacterium]
MGIVFRFIRKAFLSGLLTLLPLGVTIFAVSLLMDYVGRPVSDVLFGGVKLSAPGSFMAECIAIIFAIVAVAAVGAISRYVAGRWFIKITENVISKVPFVSMVYGTSKQIVSTFADGKRAVFQKAVLLRLPDSQISVIGFISSEAIGELSNEDAPTVGVFVPTTPNPTSGFLIFVPRSRCRELEMSIGDAMKMIISGGTFAPSTQEKDGEEVE